MICLKPHRAFVSFFCCVGCCLFFSNLTKMLGRWCVCTAVLCGLPAALSVNPAQSGNEIPTISQRISQILRTRGKGKEEENNQAREAHSFVATSSSYTTDNKELCLGIKRLWKVGAPFCVSVSTKLFCFLKIFVRGSDALTQLYCSPACPWCLSCPHSPLWFLNDLTICCS